MKLFFCIWSPDMATFLQSFQAAGILDQDGNPVGQYAGSIELSTSWNGIVTKQTGVDANGNPIIETVPGWHCNVRVSGAIAEQFTAGLPQEGTIWERTRAAQAFAITLQPADPVTGFPAGMRNAQGVRFADPSEFSSPSNVWV